MCVPSCLFAVSLICFHICCEEDIGIPRGFPACCSSQVCARSVMFPVSPSTWPPESVMAHHCSLAHHMLCRFFYSELLNFSTGWFKTFLIFAG